MKKLFRMALVLVLAGSALLYTSCTKDYSPDIKSLQDQINALGSDTDGLGYVKSQLQNVQSALSSLSGKDTELDGKISNLDGKITNAVNTINSALEGKADKATVDAALADINADIQDLKDILEGTEDAIGLIEKLEAASQSIDSLLGYADFIQSIAYVPATTDGKITVIPYQLTNKGQGEIEVFDHYEYEFNVPTGRLPREIRNWTPQQAYDYSVINFFTGQASYPYRQYVDREEIYVKTTNSQPLLVASFKVTPAEAAARATESSARLVAVQTKAAAAAPDTLTITKLVQRDDAPGYVDVYAIPGKVKFDPQTFAVALAVTQVTDTGLTESVTSDYAPAEIQQDAESIVFEIRDNNDGQIVDPNKEDTPVEVSPSSDPDSVNVFTAGRWSVVASFADSYLTPEEAKEVFGVKDIALVSPLPGDTLVDAETSSYYEWEDYGFESTVWPAGDYEIKDLVNSGNDSFSLKLHLANSHMVGSAEPSGTVVATYKAVPDQVKLALTPEHPVVIPWDYKYYDNINDTLIAKIWVSGDRDKLIGNGDAPLGKATKTWNKENKNDYTEGLGAVTKHTNDSKAIDVVLVSAAEYGKIDSTYVYSIQQYNADECVMYTGEFDYVVEARPADVTVELGPVDAIVRFANAIEFDVEPIYRAIAAHADAYAPFDTADVYPAFAAAVGNGNPKAGKATLDGKELKNFGATLDIVYSDKPEDASTLTAKINKVGQYKIPFDYKVFGIKYTFVLTVNAVNNPAKIAPKAAYVTVDDAETKDYSVEVKGDVDTSANAATGQYHYFIKDMPLKDYVKVVDYDEESETLMIGNKIATKEAVGLVQNPPSATKLDRLEEAPTVANLHDNRNYKWHDYDSLQFKVAVVLYPEADANAQIDSATVRLWTKNPIPVFDGGDMLVVEHEGDDLASANIAANLNIKDLNGISLNDSTGLRAIGWDAKAKEVVVDYDQALSYGDIKDFKLIAGADNISELLLSWDEEKTGVLNLQLNQGTIVNPIIIQVPVYLSHMLDRGLEDELTAWVTVKFMEKPSSAQ